MIFELVQGVPGKSSEAALALIDQQTGAEVAYANVEGGCALAKAQPRLFVANDVSLYAYQVQRLT